MWVKTAFGVVIITIMCRRGSRRALPGRYRFLRGVIVMCVGLEGYAGAVFQQPRTSHRHQFDRLSVLRQTVD